MAMFEGNGKSFIESLQNLDISGIRGLTSEIENATKVASEYEQKFNESLEKGIALTKRQRNAWNEYTSDVQSTISVQKALTQAIQQTWEQAKKVPSGSTEKKELTEKIDAYRQLESAVKSYSKQASSAVTVGDNAHNQKAIGKYKATLDIGHEQPSGEVIPTAQVEGQLKNLEAEAQKTGEKIKNSLAGAIKMTFASEEERRAFEAWAKVQEKKSALKEQVEHQKSLKEAEKGSEPKQIHTKEYEAEMERLKKEKEEQERLAALNPNKDKFIPTTPPLKREDVVASLAENPGAKATYGTYTQLIESINLYKDAISMLSQKMQSMDAGTEKYEQSVARLKELNAELKKMVALQTSIDKGATLTGDKDSGAQDPAATEIKNYQDLENEIERIRLDAEALRSVLKSGKSADFQKDTESLAQLEKQLKQLEAQKKLLDADKKPVLDSPDPQNYQELLAWIDTYKNAIQELQESLKNGTSSNFEKDKQDLVQMQAELKKLESAKKAIEQGSGNQENAEEQKTMNLLGYLKETIATKAKLAKEKTILPFSGDMEGVQERINALNSRLKELGAISKSLHGNVIAGLFRLIKSGASGAFNALKSGASSALSGLLSLTKTGFGLLRSAVTTTFNNMRTLASAGFNAVKKGANALSAGLKSVKSAMDSIRKKTTPNLLKSLTSLKSMLMRRIKRTFISAIFNQAKEGLQSLAKHSESFNQAMSNIKNTAQQTAGNLAVTLGNLVETIAPALQTLLGWFNKVLEAINALFAMLTGKKTVTVAKKGTDDYAKSLKKASGSAKELNNQLYGFDEITRQEGNNGGSGSGDSGIEYEEMAVDSVLGNLKGVFEEIINAFKAGEFEKVGQLVAEQLNNVIYAIDDFVVSIREKAVTWSSNIARILNGLVDGWDANATGKLLADGINLVFDVINTFISTFDFNALGKKLGDGIKGIFDNIEWDLVGETIANWFNMLPRFLSGLFETIPWSDLGKNLATGVMSMFNNIDWEARKQAFVRGINGITDTLYNFITNVDLGDIASKFFNNVNGIVNGIKWDKLKDTVVAGVEKIKDALSEMIKSGFFTNLTSRMGELVGGILNDIDFEGLAKLVSIGLSKLRFAFWGFINRIDFPNLAKKLGNAINGMFTDSHVKESWEESRKQAVEGINGIIKAFGILVNGDENGEGAIDFVGMARTIGDDLSRMITQINFSDAVRNIGTLIVKLATAFFELIGEVFTPKEGKGLGQQLADGLNGLFKNDKGEVDTSLFSGLGESIHKAIIALISTVADFVENVDIDAIVKGIVALLEKINFGDIAKKLVTLVGDGLTKLVDAIPNLLTGILQVINSIPWLDVATAILENLGKVALSAIKAVGGVIGTLWDWLWGQGAFENAPEIVNAQTVQEWQDQMGDAGQKSAQAYLDELHRIVEEDDSWSQPDYDNESNRKAILAAAGAMGIGYQEEFAKAVEEGWLQSSEYAYLSQATDEMLETIKNSSSIQGVKDVFATYGMQITGLLADHLRGKGKEDIAASIALLGAGMEEEAIASMNIDGLSSHIRSYMSETGLSIQEIALYLTGKTKDEIAEMTGQTAEEVGKKLGGITPEAMRKSLEEGIIYVQDANGQLIEAAKATPSDATEAKKSSEAVGKGATEGASEKIKEGTEAVSTAASGMMGAIKTILNEENQPIQDEISAMNKGIDEKISELPEEEQKHAKEMMNLLLSAIEEGDPTVVSAIESCANSVVAKVQDILATSKGYDIAKGFMDGMTNAVISHESGSYSFVSRVGQYAMDALYKANFILAFSNGETIGENIINGMSQGVTNLGQNLVDNIETCANSVVLKMQEILASSKGYDIANGFMDGMTSAVVSHESGAYSLTSCVGQYAMDALYKANSILTFSNGETIGENIIKGMYQGVTNWGQALVDKVAEACQAVIDTTTTAFEINSPSRVFAEIGGYVMEGLSNGIEDESRSAIDAVSDVADAMSNNDISVNAFGDLDTVESKLVRIASIFNDIASTLSDMGGLTIPTVANGQVLPYRTKVADMPTEANQNFVADGSLEDAIYSAFNRAMGTSNSEQQVINITLQIDGRKMADIVSKYQRQQNRAWGV